MLTFVKSQLSFLDSFFFVYIYCNEKVLPKIKKMSRAVFDYTKVVLQKVSFNSELFNKEVEKAVQSLLPFEIKELKIWLNSFTINKPELRKSLALIA